SRTARLGTALAALNVWLLHNAWFTWPKMLVVYFLLLSLAFYLRFLAVGPADSREGARAFRWCWAAAWLGFMTHQVSLVYLGALLLHAAALAWRERAYRPRVAELAVLAGVALLIAGPWYGWLAGNQGASELLAGTPVTRMTDDSGGLLQLPGSVAYNAAA